VTALQPRGSVCALPLPRSYSAPDGARKPAASRPPPRAELRAVMERAQLVGATGTDAAILAALWSHADRHGGCWPSQARLAALTGRCERTVRTSVQRLAALGLIVRAVPAPSSRRWGWTDPTTGKRRGARRSTVYTLTGDASREPRPVATIGADVEPSPEITAAVARVEAAHAAALARLDAPELTWGDVEAVDLVVAPVEAPAVAELEIVTGAAPVVVDVEAPPVAPLAAPYLRGPFTPPVDRQRLPPKRPERTQSARARATAPAPSPAAPPWRVLSAAAIARAKAPSSPTGAVEAPRRAIVRAVDVAPPRDAPATVRAGDGVPPELVARLQRLVSRRR
jgi:hypothetical protein